MGRRKPDSFGLTLQGGYIKHQHTLQLSVNLGIILQNRLVSFIITNFIPLQPINFLVF